jgi:hypothetical protein
MMTSDARVELLFGPASLAGPGDAVLAAPAESGLHPAGCACCVGRGALATALGRLFMARARGEVAFFRRVVVTGADAATRAALAADSLVSARFRLGGLP